MWDVDPGGPYTYAGVVTRIIDGDTVEAVVELGFSLNLNVRLRLLGINAPEMHAKDPTVRSRAVEAQATLGALCMGSQVLVETSKPDSFGRYLARVWTKDLCINDEMLRLGVVDPY